MIPPNPRSSVRVVTFLLPWAVAASHSAVASAQSASQGTTTAAPAVTAEASAEVTAEVTAEPAFDLSGAPAERGGAMGARTAAGRAVARWPASAYPEPRTRGLYGGSLWLTFHGLQWPYAPQMDEGPDTQLGLSGYAWVDSGYRRVDSDDDALFTEDKVFQQGRLVLRGTPTYTSGSWFVQAQGELVASKDPGEALRIGADDVWVRAGQWDVFDVQVGRFEAWEIYHRGMGLDPYTLEREGAVLDGPPPNGAPEIYGATFLFDRPTTGGNVAAHIYPLDVLRFEVLGRIGNDGFNTFGARPAAILDLGWLKAKAAFEFLHRRFQSEASDASQTAKGSSVALQLVFDPIVELGVSGGYGIDDHFDERDRRLDAESTTRASGGAFVNVRVAPPVLLGAGGHYTKYWDLAEDVTGRVGEFDHIQAFLAAQYLFLDQLFIKAVVGYANALTAPSGTPDYHENTMFSGRLRLQYLF